VEVLGLLAAGRSNQCIAGELVVSLDTVKKHVSHVLDKLGITAARGMAGRYFDVSIEVVGVLR